MSDFYKQNSQPAEVEEENKAEVEVEPQACVSGGEEEDKVEENPFDPAPEQAQEDTPEIITEKPQKFTASDEEPETAKEPNELEKEEEIPVPDTLEQENDGPDAALSPAHIPKPQEQAMAPVSGVTPKARKSTKPVAKSRLYEPTAASKAAKREKKQVDSELEKPKWGR